MGCGVSRDPVPWQQIVDAIGQVIGDAGQDVGVPGLRIKAVQLGGAYRTRAAKNRIERKSCTEH